MTGKILIAYASRYGSTREIAEDLARVFYERGARVEVWSAAEVGSLEPYTAVVLGSAVHSGDWLPEASAFLRKFEGELCKRPVWLFSSVPIALAAWTFPEGLRALAEAIKPKGIKIFFNAVDPARVAFEEQRDRQRLPVGSGDTRDWREIEAWANEIADHLKPAEFDELLAAPLPEP